MKAAASPTSAPTPDYDLYLRGDTSRFFWRLADRGVRLVGDRLEWTAGGRGHAARLEQIAEIHLTRGGGLATGGDSPLLLMRLIAQRRSTTASVCRIRFRDGTVLLVLDAEASGLPDPARAGPYSEFVVRLHERLAARGRARIDFVAGFSPFRYRLLFLLLGLLGLIDLGALVALFVGARPEHLFLIAGASLWLWFQWRLVRDNAPVRYDPAAVPDAMLPAAVAHRLPAPPGAAPRPIEDATDAAARAAGDWLSRRWPWLLPAPGLAVVAALIWAVGTNETATMFEPDAARRALIALEQHAGEVPHFRSLEVTPRMLSAAVETTRTHADSQGLASRIETWRITHVTLFSGWREWERVSGPRRADGLPVLQEAMTKPFVLRPRELPDLGRMAREAVEHAGFENSSVQRMSLVHHDPINPTLGQASLRWTVHVASPRESAEVVFDHAGHYAGADLAGTLHRRNLDLLGAGNDFDATLRAIRVAIGDGPVIAFMRITPKQIVMRTDSKQYEADDQGVVDKTPQAFFCHMTTDVMTGRFALAAVDRTLLASLQERAREAAPMPVTQIVAIVLSPAAGARGLTWSVEARSGGKVFRVLFDAGGTLLGVRAWDERQSCE